MLDKRTDNGAAHHHGTGSVQTDSPAEGVNPPPPINEEEDLSF